MPLHILASLAAGEGIACDCCDADIVVIAAGATSLAYTLEFVVELKQPIITEKIINIAILLFII